MTATPTAITTPTKADAGSRRRARALQNRCRSPTFRHRPVHAAFRVMRVLMKHVDTDEATRSRSIPACAMTLTTATARSPRIIPAAHTRGTRTRCPGLPCRTWQKRLECRVVGFRHCGQPDIPSTGVPLPVCLFFHPPQGPDSGGQGASQLLLRTVRLFGVICCWVYRFTYTPMDLHPWSWTVR